MVLRQTASLALMLLFIASSEATELYFKNPFYSYQFLRTIGYSPTGGADICECLQTAARIEEGNDQSWFREWYQTAAQLESTAKAFLETGHRLSAKEAFFRASNYYRTAELMLHSNPGNPNIITAWSKSIYCFQQAAALSEFDITPIKIPYRKTTLPGYFCRTTTRQTGNHPLLIIQAGFDGCKEELYFAFAKAALERGYNCLLFDGPGQGEVIRFQGLPFVYNWESVITPVVNYALQQPNVDSRHLVLIGFSFGGYLAPRAAAFENRIAICIADGGVYDFYATFARHFPDNVDELLSTEKRAEKLDKEIYNTMKTRPEIRWAFGNGMWVFRAGSPADLLRKLVPYNLKRVAKHIKCRMLVVNSTHDHDMPGQSRQLYDALTTSKSYMVFNKAEGAAAHCQVGAVTISNERILNWLDEMLATMKEH